MPINYDVETVEAIGKVGFINFLREKVFEVQETTKEIKKETASRHDWRAFCKRGQQYREGSIKNKNSLSVFLNRPHNDPENISLRPKIYL